MSAKSQAREKAAREEALRKKYADLPEPGVLSEPDPEFDRLLGWFVTNRKEIAEHLGVKKVIVDCTEGRLLVIPKPQPLRPGVTIDYSKGMPPNA